MFGGTVVKSIVSAGGTEHVLGKLHSLVTYVYTAEARSPNTGLYVLPGLETFPSPPVCFTWFVPKYFTVLDFHMKGGKLTKKMCSIIEQKIEKQLDDVVYHLWEILILFPYSKTKGLGNYIEISHNFVRRKKKKSKPSHLVNTAPSNCLP